MPGFSRTHWFQSNSKDATCDEMAVRKGESVSGSLACMPLDWEASMKSRGFRRRVLGLGALACAIIVLGSIGLPTTADAAKIYYAFYKIKISHHRNTEDFFVERRSSRSWGSVETCKSDSPRLTDRHIWSVRRLNIVTARGTVPQLTLHSIECREL